MKKIFLIIFMATAMAAISCENEFLNELNELHTEIDYLKAGLEKTNSNIAALGVIVNALQDNDYVKGITPVYEGTTPIGYMIDFSKSGSVTIYHGQDGEDGASGKDGHTPAISVKQDTDGIWYWTIDGEWMTDGNGGKVKAIGKTPQLRIDNGYWHVTYDEGKSWSQLGKATGKDGDAFFEDIIVTDTEVTFIMKDGDRFTTPRSRKVELIMDIPDVEAGVLPGSEIIINYTLNNASRNTIVTASSNGIYSVRVEASSYEKGKIYVKAPFIYADGYINVMVSDGESYSYIKVINFYEEKMIFSKGLEYYVSPKGGEITIPFSTNFDHEFVVSGSSRSWISIVESGTKAQMESGKLIVNIAANTLQKARNGKIQVIPANSAGDYYTEIVINQASSIFSIEQSKYAVHVDGETITTAISSSHGVTAKIPAEAAEWISCQVTDLGNDNYSIATKVERNGTLSMRSAIVELYSEYGNELLGSIEYAQASSIENDLGYMILTVRANISNDFTAKFNIHGPNDFYIDWGDGQAERFQNYFYNDWGNLKWEDGQLSHTYNTTEPSNYTVKIYGTMSLLSTELPCVTEVIQWGQTGLTSIDFSNNYLLTSVPEDNSGSFQNLLDISFCGCTRLTSVSEDIFKYAGKVTSFEGTFSGCTSLTTIPEKLFAECKNVTWFGSTFYGCTSLTTIPEKLFAECKNVTSFEGTFSGCTSLTAIPEKLFAECKNVTWFGSTFSGCTSLTTVPVSIFDHNRKVTCFHQTFCSCPLYQGESPYTVINGHKYHLYERFLNPDYFIPPTEYEWCFTDTQISDKDEAKKYGWMWM